MWWIAVQTRRNRVIFQILQKWSRQEFSLAKSTAEFLFVGQELALAWRRTSFPVFVPVSATTLTPLAKALSTMI